jgi:pimeloyl-ACP methyl ester carboxylesterase
MHPGRSLYRAAPAPLPLWAEPDYVAHADGLRELYPLTGDQIRAGLPGLVGSLELDNVGHWLQHEASAEVSDQLVKFLHTVNPA